MKAKIGAIVQARMSSERFPNKILYEVHGKPMLQYLLERMEHCRQLDDIVVATSSEDSDDAIADFCRNNEVECFRGLLSNVAGRFRQVLDKYGFGVFVRVNGDSPLLDQSLIDNAIKIFRSDDFDIVTNVMPRTYPSGQSVEVLKTATFQNTYTHFTEAEDLEHVTRYFYNHSGDFRIHNFALEENLKSIKLSVDNWQDMSVLAKILSKMPKPHWEYHLEEIIRLYHSVAGEVER